MQQQNTKNNAEKAEEKYVEYVDLSPDFIGSTVTAVYKHKDKYGQRYSSYDDGSILVFEYKTKDGKKCFSIGNGNINSPKSVPINGTFLFNEEETGMLLKWGNPESDVICPNCDSVCSRDEVTKGGLCEDCVDED